MTGSYEEAFGEAVKAIRNVYRNYSVEDIATSLFVSNIWLPNIACPIKHIFFVTSFCTMKPEEFTESPVITDYNGFEQFLREIYNLAPDFSTLEDYVPELDWGEVKYSLNKKLYRIFFGGDLSNAYDHLTLFQMLYEPFDEKYKELVHRSPMEELRHALTIQDSIITSIHCQPSEDTLEVLPGDIALPSKRFWRDSVRIYNSIDYNEIVGIAFLKNYSTKLGVLSSNISIEHFWKVVTDDLTFATMFIEHKNHYFLILPRRISGILFDTWGEMFKRCQNSLPNNDKPIELEIGSEFSQFVKDRFLEKDTLFFVSARSGEKDTHEVVFPVAIKSRDKLTTVRLK